MTFRRTLFLRAAPLCLAGVAVTACATLSEEIDQAEMAAKAEMAKLSNVPATKFDLSHWNITVPTDADNNEKVDTVSVADLQSYAHPDYFHLNDAGEIVFVSPNKALTTPNSSNTRSELRYMSRGSDTSIKTKAPGNNFALASHPDAASFASVGGRMEATLRVEHVSVNAGHPDKEPAYSAVVGQIHGAKVDDNSDGFGYGNEPLKIYFKKFPDHETGSIFWNYEKNLAKEDPKRKDVAYAVWGNTWDVKTDPGAEGIALGEEFSYTVNVYEDVMTLVFESPTKETKTFQINLANNVDANGNVDVDDNPKGYTGDAMYFKAGIYNQCSTKDDPGFWYTACPGTGDWETDQANGNYAAATFSRLVVMPAEEM